MIKMEKLKVGVLYYEALDKGKMAHDYVVEEVAEALTAGGHTTSLMSVGGDVRELLDKLDAAKPDIVFNLCETFAGKDVFEMNVTALLEMLGVRFTGTGPAGMVLRRDKALTKKLLRFYDLTCSDYAIFDKTNLEFAGRMRFPLFVKPLRGDASLCIDDFSLVTEYGQLIERVNAIQTQLNDAALIEEYIEGRELYACVLGNNPSEVLPLIEMEFSKMPKEHPSIYGWQAKFDEKSAQYDATDARVAKDLSPEIRSRVMKAGREAVRALQTDDYARVDIRVTPEGTPYVIEVNANPYLEKTSEFAMAALAAGMDYPTLINHILDVAWQRWDNTAPRNVARPTRAEIRLRAIKSAATCSGLPADEEDREKK